MTSEGMLCGASSGEDKNGFLVVCVLNEYHTGAHEWVSEPNVADFKALTDLFWNACETGDPYCMGNPEQAARDLLASEWLTEHDAQIRAQPSGLAERLRGLPAQVAREVHESYCGTACEGGKNCEGALGKREKQILRAAVRALLAQEDR